MKATIISADYAPGDLYEQLPITLELFREIPGPNRTDYWLGRLERPLQYAREGGVVQIKHLILAARYVGESIHPRAGEVIVGITYVLDDTQAELSIVDMSKCLYAAIGQAIIA